LQAVGDPIASARSAGIVMSWDQSSMKLYTGGDSRHIQVWNAASEMKEQVNTKKATIVFVLLKIITT